MLGVEAPRDDAVRLHHLQPIGQEGGGDAREGGLQVLEASRAPEQIADEEQRPPLAHELQGLGDRTGLTVPLRHGPRIACAGAVDKKV
jgi:hypothetical protein